MAGRSLQEGLTQLVTRVERCRINVYRHIYIERERVGECIYIQTQHKYVYIHIIYIIYIYIDIH